MCRALRTVLIAWVKQWRNKVDFKEEETKLLSWDKVSHRITEHRIKLKHFFCT